MLQPLSNPTHSEAPQGSGRVIDPLGSLRRHKLAAALVFLAIACLGMPYAWVKGKSMYRAEGALYVSPRFLNNLETSEEHLLQSNTQYREYMQQQIRTVTRFDILMAALRRPGMMKLWKRSNETERQAAERLRAAVQLASVPDTYQISVALEGDKAAGLSELVNGLMEEFSTIAHKELMWDSDGRLAKLNGEKANLEAEIAGLMERKSGMSDKLGTTVFNDSIVNSYDKRLASALDSLEDAKRQRFAAEAAMSGQAAPGVNASAMEKTMSDSGLASLRGALSQRKATLLTQMQGLAPQHAGRIAAEKELREIDNQIDQLTAQVQGRWQSGMQDINRSRYEQAKQLEARIQSEVDTLRGQTEAFSRGYQSTLEISDEIARLRRRLNATEDRISFLNLETNAPGFIRVFSPALTPELPFQGGRKKLFVMVLLAALLIAAVVPTGIDMLDSRIMTAKELEMLAGLPVCGAVAVSGAGPGEIGVRRLAVILRRHLRNLPRKAVVLTGVSEAGDSAKVAFAAARELRSLGMRPLLLEARPGSGEDRPGLAELLAGEARIEDCIVPGMNGAPDSIPAGVALSEQDLLPVDNLLSILEAASGYDMVLIDAAPVSHSLVTEELVRLSGAVLLVTAGAADTKKEFAAALSTLTRLQPEAFGTILNTVPVVSKSRKARTSKAKQLVGDAGDAADLIAA